MENKTIVSSGPDVQQRKASQVAASEWNFSKIWNAIGH
jgi:hypothetical protein